MGNESDDTVDVRLDADLDELNSEGRLDENSAMQVQTVRDLTRLLEKVEKITESIEPVKKKSVIRIISRDSK